MALFLLPGPLVFRESCGRSWWRRTAFARWFCSAVWHARAASEMTPVISGVRNA